MIRLLVKLGDWLDKRFPEKVQVTKEVYNEFDARILATNEAISLIRGQVDLLTRNVDATVARLGTVETNAVHKGAVADVVKVVSVLKDDIISLKANLGMNRSITEKEMQIMLSGEPVNEQ